MNALCSALQILRPGVNFADLDGNLAHVRWDEPLPDGFTAPTQQEVVAATLSLAKGAKLNAAGAAFLAASKAGLSHGGKLFQLDESSQQNIAALSTRAGLTAAGVPGATWPQGFAFIASDNTPVPFTAAQFVAFGNAAADRVIALRFAYRALKDSILAAASIEALDAIDVSEGWEGQ